MPRRHGMTVLVENVDNRVGERPSDRNRRAHRRVAWDHVVRGEGRRLRRPVTVDENGVWQGRQSTLHVAHRKRLAAGDHVPAAASALGRSSITTLNNDAVSQRTVTP